MRATDKKAIAIVAVVVGSLAYAIFVGLTFDPMSITKSDAWDSAERLEGAAWMFRLMRADEVYGDWGLFHPESEPGFVRTISLLNPTGWLTFGCSGGLARGSYFYGVDTSAEPTDNVRVVATFDSPDSSPSMEWRADGMSPPAVMTEGVAEAFRREAQGSKTVVLRAIRGERDTTVHRFSLYGLDDAFRQLSCTPPDEMTNER